MARAAADAAAADAKAAAEAKVAAATAAAEQSRNDSAVSSLDTDRTEQFSSETPLTAASSPETQGAHDNRDVRSAPWWDEKEPAALTPPLLECAENRHELGHTHTVLDSGFISPRGPVE